MKTVLYLSDVAEDEELSDAESSDQANSAAISTTEMFLGSVVVGMVEVSQFVYYLCVYVYVLHCAYYIVTCALYEFQPGSVILNQTRQVDI